MACPAGTLSQPASKSASDCRGCPWLPPGDSTCDEDTCNEQLRCKVTFCKTQEPSFSSNHGDCENIGSWDTSIVTDMSRLFYGAASFDLDLGAWNTSSVTNMSGMFKHASSFRGANLSFWDVRSAETLEEMFDGASSFQTQLCGWEVKEAAITVRMFAGTCPKTQLVDAGFYCPDATETLLSVVCPVGFFCLGGDSTSSAESCDTTPAGSYCAEGTTSASGFVACPEGYYCLGGSSDLVGCSANPGTYCPRGTNSSSGAIMCPEGYFCKGNSTASMACTSPPGNYCPLGTAHESEMYTPCPEGFFCLGGNHRAEVCSVSAGKHCPTGTSSPAGSPCPIGYYCSGGQGRKLGCAPVIKADEFCPEEGMVSAPVACPAGTHTNTSTFAMKLVAPKQSRILEPVSLTLTMQGTLPCIALHVLIIMFLWAVRGVEDCIPCKPGYFCPFNARDPTKCNPGTFSKSLRASFCKPCEPGSYQDVPGKSSCKQCSPGNYCSVGASAPLPCPAGYRTNPSIEIMRSLSPYPRQ